MLMRMQQAGATNMNRVLTKFKATLPGYEMTDDRAEESYACAVLSVIYILHEAKRRKAINMTELWRTVLKYSINSGSDCFGLHFRWPRDNAYDFKAMHLKWPIIKLAANGLLEVWEVPRGKEYTKLMAPTDAGCRRAQTFIKFVRGHTQNFLWRTRSRRIAQFKLFLGCMAAKKEFREVISA